MYEIDWHATGSMLSGIGTLGAAIIAFETARRWLSREKFKLDRGPAQEVLGAFEAARLAFKTVRSEHCFPAEVETAERLLDDQAIDVSAGAIGDVMRTRLVRRVIVLNRIASFKEIWKNIIDQMSIATVLFGKDVHDELLNVNGIKNEIVVAAEEYADPKLNDEEEARLYSILVLPAKQPDRAEDRILRSLQTSQETLFEELKPYLTGIAPKKKRSRSANQINKRHPSS